MGAVLTGNDVAAAGGAAAGIVGVAILVVATAAVRRPAVLTALQRPAGWTLRHAWGLCGRTDRDPDAVLASLAARLGSLRLPASGWAAVVAAALLNWLADVGVLAASIVAVGGAVPWRGLLFAYGVGTAAGSVGVIPGGLGVVEAALALSLMGAGVRHPLALAAVARVPLNQLLDGHRGGLANLPPRGPGPLGGHFGDSEAPPAGTFAGVGARRPPSERCGRGLPDGRAARA